MFRYSLYVWVIIVIASVAPVLWRRVRGNVRPARLYVGIAVATVVLLVPIHIWQNNVAQEGLKNASRTTAPYSSGRDGLIYLIFTDDIVEVAGPFAWRFLNWGVVEGGGSQTWFTRFLRNDLRIREDVARHFDVTNPPPVMLVAWFLLLAVLTVRSNDDTSSTAG